MWVLRRRSSIRIRRSGVDFSGRTAPGTQVRGRCGHEGSAAGAEGRTHDVGCVQRRADPRVGGGASRRWVPRDWLVWGGGAERCEGGGRAGEGAAPAGGRRGGRLGSGQAAPQHWRRRQRRAVRGLDAHPLGGCICAGAGSWRRGPHVVSSGRRHPPNCIRCTGAHKAGRPRGGRLAGSRAQACPHAGGVGLGGRPGLERQRAGPRHAWRDCVLPGARPTRRVGIREALTEGLRQQQLLRSARAGVHGRVCLKAQELCLC
mmetsp:Transcript_17679/g.53199  ORF Transcript_17679/g.53199 Transcript_17679/m.53199 type:complete len:260 (-) Transcript_17679:214-993(-)